MLVKQYSYILNYIRRKVEGTKSQFDCLKLVLQLLVAKVRKGQVTVLQPYFNNTAKVGRKTRPGSEILEVSLAKEKNFNLHEN